MVRRGSEKVRTGCFTCKCVVISDLDSLFTWHRRLILKSRTRKVKCDETKPHCHRCTSTGRSCDGYPDPPTGQAAYSWADLISIRNAAPIVTRRSPSNLCTSDVTEARALEYFRLQVAPFLSRNSSKPLWNILVSQVGQQEPAVRHALICISSIYEGLGETNRSPLVRPRERFAITQYNIALKQLASAATDENIVLLVCLLFICIEMLQGNREVAIQHCRHGIMICNNMSKGLLGWAKQALQPIFLRLATFPYFFGVEVADFPEPVGLVSDGLATGVTAEDKTMAWDYLVNRTVRLIRLGLSYRQGSLQHLPMPDFLFVEREPIYESLVTWQHHYRTTRGTYPPEHEGLESHIYEEIKCIVGKIWVGCFLSVDELVYDEYFADFEEILHLSEQLVQLKTTESGPRPKFIFEMASLPFLYFVVLKCRRLDLRLKALQQIPLVSHEQENLFNAKTLYSVCRRSLEVEHGIILDSCQAAYAGASDAPLPPNGARMRSVSFGDEVEVRKDENGVESIFKKVFFLFKPGAIISGYTELVEIMPLPGRHPYIQVPDKVPDNSHHEQY